MTLNPNTARDVLQFEYPAIFSRQGHTGAGARPPVPAPVTVSTRGTDRPGARPISGHTAPGVWPAGENDMSEHFEDLNEEPNIHPPLWAFATAIAAGFLLLMGLFEYAAWGDDFRASRALPMISEGFPPRP